MSRAALARRLALAAALLPLAGCPIPQPLPTYASGTVTPPRILSASVTSGGQSVIPVPAGCASPPRAIDLSAQVFYSDPFAIEARWFVDYRKDRQSRYALQNPNGDTTVTPVDATTFRVPTFSFQPYGFPVPEEQGGGAPDAAGVVHVVELVVSNGFDASDAAAEPNRTPGVNPADGRQFEIQTHRWVFVNVAGLACE